MKRSFLFLLLSLILCSQTRKSTSTDNQLSETALSYCKSGNYNMARDIYLKKIELGKATPDDYYNLGKVYYNLKDYKMADSSLAICNEKKPDFIPGFMWRARSLSNLDPDSKAGKAKPVYEIILEKTGRHAEK
jgi:tetratricopeptide (TPR) repeat protein